MTTELFDFETQNTVGILGESHFLQDYQWTQPTKSLQDLSYDFHFSGHNEKVELKTDTYKMEKTENLFIESHVIRFDNGYKKIGGPFRAKQDQVRFFVYYFIKDRTYLWYNTIKMVERIDKWIAINFPYLVEVKNKGYSSFGYIIPRNIFYHELIKQQTFNN